MKEIPEYEKDLASIRTMMERSVKFISLSGLSGVLSGVFALAGALVAYFLMYYPNAPYGHPFYGLTEKFIVVKLLITAAGVLVLSLGTGYGLSLQKARKLNDPIWNHASRQLLMDLLIPLATGGLFILILISLEFYIIIAPTCLIFYGLALINGSRNTYDEVKYLGLTEIVLGLVSALLPSYSLLFWATGFGLMHILYGAIMYYRHDR